jgi:acyl-CoA thioester hydrolase
MTPLPYEVDFTGFLSNTVAPQWMERLRVLLMAKCFPEVDLTDATNLSVIRRTEVDYLRPIRFTDPITGRAFIKKVLSSSWVVGFSFTNMLTWDVCFEGSQTGVFIDATTFKPKRMPSLINQKLKSLEV